MGQSILLSGLETNYGLMVLLKMAIHPTLCQRITAAKIADCVSSQASRHCDSCRAGNNSAPITTETNAQR